MNKTQITSLRSYIKKHNGLSNKNVAEKVVKESNTFKGYSVGSVANYIGKVKKLPKKTISTEAGHIMNQREKVAVIPKDLAAYPVLPKDCFDLSLSREGVFDLVLKDLPNATNRFLANEIHFRGYLKKLSLSSIATYIGKYKVNNITKKVVKIATPIHYDVLVIGVNTKIANISNYLNEAAQEAIRTVIEVGDDARVKIQNVQSGEHLNYLTIDSSVGGLKEHNAIYDGIQMALNHCMHKIEDCSATDVNITIVTNGSDYGSRICTLEETSEMINKFSRSFGWTINLVYKGEKEEATKLARDLSIDTSNIYFHTSTDNLISAMMQARKCKTKYLEKGHHINYDYFN